MRYCSLLSWQICILVLVLSFLEIVSVVVWLEILCIVCLIFIIFQLLFVRLLMGLILLALSRYKFGLRLSNFLMIFFLVLICVLFEIWLLMKSVLLLLCWVNCIVIGRFMVKKVILSLEGRRWVIFRLVVLLLIRMCMLLWKRFIVLWVIVVFLVQV